MKKTTGQPDFSQLNQTFVTVTDITANVDYISSAVQRKWGADHVLVTADGLRLDDSAQGMLITYGCIFKCKLCIRHVKYSVLSTLVYISASFLVMCPGLDFWKVGSRKVFAVRVADLKVGKRERERKQIVISDSSDDDDDFQPKRSKQAKDFKHLVSEIQDMHADFEHLFRVNKTLQLPIGLHKMIREAFCLCICHSSPMVPPIIYARCCKSLVGCQVCVDTWYMGEEGRSTKCPMCRGDRAYAETTPVRGLEEFIKAIEPILQQPDCASTSQGGHDDHQWDGLNRCKEHGYNISYKLHRRLYYYYVSMTGRSSVCISRSQHYPYRVPVTNLWYFDHQWDGLNSCQEHGHISHKLHRWLYYYVFCPVSVVHGTITMYQSQIFDISLVFP